MGHIFQRKNKVTLEWPGECLCWAFMSSLIDVFVRDRFIELVKLQLRVLWNVCWAPKSPPVSLHISQALAAGCQYQKQHCWTGGWEQIDRRCNCHLQCNVSVEGRPGSSRSPFEPCHFTNMTPCHKVVKGQWSCVSFRLSYRWILPAAS